MSFCFYFFLLDDGYGYVCEIQRAIHNEIPRHPMQSASLSLLVVNFFADSFFPRLFFVRDVTLTQPQAASVTPCDASRVEERDKDRIMTGKQPVIRR